ncbi:MAG: DUF488 family protein [bacterium]
MLRIFTGQIGEYKLEDGIDISFRTQTIFSPTKELELKIKNNKEEYISRYYELMRNSYINNKKYWDEILNMEHITLLCYCREDSFCHRYLIKDILIKLGAKYYGEI